MTIRYNPNDGTGCWYEDKTEGEYLDLFNQRLIDLMDEVTDMRRDSFVNYDRIRVGLQDSMDIALQAREKATF